MGWWATQTKKQAHNVTRDGESHKGENSLYVDIENKKMEAKPTGKGG